MNKLKEMYQLLNNEYTKIEVIKSIVTGFVFFIFPTLLLIGVLIVIGTIYPYWNTQILLIGSSIVFLYGLWTNKIVIETLNNYNQTEAKQLNLFALFMQIALLIAIIIVDIVVITTIF